MTDPPTTSRPRRVCVFTGSRAEYGLLAPIIRRIQQSDALTLQLIASGSHLSSLHGQTVGLITADGFEVDASVEMLLASDSPVAITKSIGIAMMDLAVQLDRLDPDILVVLGDRYELIAAVTAAMIRSTPVAHVHGGETTEGAFDDLIRHAVTKMAHLHFPAAPQFAERIMQMGEDPSRVHLVRAPALDTLSGMARLSPADLERLLGVTLTAPVCLVSYHPVTVGDEDPAEAVANIVRACSEHDGTVVACMPNADPRNSSIRTVLEQAAADDPRVTLIDSVGHVAFLSLVAQTDVFVGNSSSAVIEAPTLKTPVVLVGGRQEGRPLAGNIVSSGTALADLRAALDRALSDDFARAVATAVSPYEHGVSAATRIVDVLETVSLPDLLVKRFVDDVGEPS